MFVPNKIFKKTSFQEFLKEESDIKEISINPCFELKIEFPKEGWMEFYYQNHVFRSKLDGYIQYSIMNKQTGQKNWYKIQETWNNLYILDKEALRNIIRNLFKNNQMVIRYKDTFTNVKIIYGIVYEGYKAIDPNMFRETFKKEAFARGLKYSPENSHLNKFNKYIEMYIPPKQKGFESSISYMLTYGRSNGISPYKVGLNREIIVCSNGITSYDKFNELYFKHNELSHIQPIISNIFKQADEHHQLLENQISLSKDRMLDEYAVNDFADKNFNEKNIDRFYKKLNDEINKNDKTEWALSQTFTDISTHANYVGFELKFKLREAGTAIIEIGFENYLRKVA